ncbi:hypothetical protein H5410_030196 [Solanum commersonii]|uniref:Uncharacterized protein n=1 Tax=Solanum commersonii TaxID=4109 RepID=A0A9J5YF15_SOLCO|nr:hypothetical protein H5410_030196 [Solanum commersonii]
MTDRVLTMIDVMGTEGRNVELASLPQPKVTDTSSYSLHPLDHPGELQGLMPTSSCTCGCICGATKKMQFVREEKKFRGHQKNQNEPNALAGTTLATTIEEVMSPVLGLTHA